MKKKILIYNDNSRRDLLTLTLLKKELKNRGFKVLICNPDEVNHRMYTYKPDIFIGARADHSSPIRKYSNACKVFIVPGEGGHMTKETMLSVFLGRSYWKLDSVDWITRCYLWSSSTKDWLMETKMFKDDQLLVSGNPRLDIYYYKQILHKKNIDNKKLTIGVAFSSKSTSAYYGQYNYIQEYLEMNEKSTFPILANENRNFEDISWRDHSILRRIINVVKKTIEETNYNFIFRPSPFENSSHFKILERKYPGRIKIDNKSTLPNFISNIDLVLTCWSTVGLEALIMKKPIISISGLYDKEYLFQHISKKASGFETFVEYYYSPENIDEIINLFHKCKNGKLEPSPKKIDQVNELLQKIYKFPNEKSATDIICDDIEDEINNSSFDYNALRRDLPLKNYFFSYRLQFFIFKIFVLFRTIFSGNMHDYLQFRQNSNHLIDKLTSLYFSKKYK